MIVNCDHLQPAY